jgi:hypothetical protein
VVPVVGSDSEGLAAASQGRSPGFRTYYLRMQRDQSLDSDIQQTEQLEPHKEAEQNEESPEAGDLATINAGDRSHFFTVSNALLAAIDPNAPELRLPENLSRREVEAIKLIYEAKTARESEKGSGRVAATERLQFLNLGLAHLNRVLAMARNPEFQQARPYIELIRQRLHRLREEIEQAILDEERRRRVDKDKKKAEDETKAEDEAKKKKAPLDGAKL